MQLGQASVLIAQTEKSKADALVVSTQTSVTKASNHKVEFGSRTYSSLTKGKCDTFFSHSNYVTAKATYKAAGAAAEATKILKIKISAAAKAKHECLCKTQKSHATEFSSRSAANAANKAAWDLAHKILCELDRKTTCKWGGVPTLRRASITTAAKNEKC